MQESIKVSSGTSTKAMVANDLNGRLSRRDGAVAGLIGAVIMMAVIGGIVLATGYSLFTAPVAIASIVFGEGASGMFPIVVGTIIHLATGTALGYLFAALMPSIHRTMWLVAGLIYGILAWGFSTVVILPLLSQSAVPTDTFGPLLIAHVLYGFTLGVAGNVYDWSFNPFKDTTY